MTRLPRISAIGVIAGLFAALLLLADTARADDAKSTDASTNGIADGTTDNATPDGNPEDATTTDDAKAPAPPFVRGPGGYLNPGLLVVYLALFTAWIVAVRWAALDVRALHGADGYWIPVMIAAGALGSLLVWLIPVAVLGFVVQVMSILVPVLMYARLRNRRVPASQRVFVPAHLYAVADRVLGRIGITLPGSADVAMGSPRSIPIELVTKSRVSAGKDVDTPQSVRDSVGYHSARQLVLDSIVNRATDLHLEPGREDTVVRYRVDGVMYTAGRLERRTGDMVVNVFKIVAAMDISERRRPQDGSFRVVREDEHGVIDVRVATQGTSEGEKMSLRLLHQNEDVGNLSGLGLRRHLQGALRDIVEQPHGLFLVCGPTGAGKSTTLRAAIQEIDVYSKNVITIEDPVEYQLEGVNQIEVESKAGQSFATTLRSVLRQDPDIVLLGEIRDGETAEIACQAANTGHMVFSTIHANDATAAVSRLVELGADPFLVSDSLSAVLAQRLARRLCPECREAYRPKAADVRRLRLPVEKVSKFYRPRRDPDDPCEHCNGIGYVGRTGVFELLVVDETLRPLIGENASANDLRRAASAAGMLPMRREGLQLVTRGVISLAELDRVVR